MHKEYTISWAKQFEQGVKPTPMYATYMGPGAHAAASQLIHALIFDPTVVFIGLPKSLEHVLVDLMASDMVLSLLRQSLMSNTSH